MANTTQPPGNNPSASETSAMEDIENQTNDLINKMRKASGGYTKEAAANHPKLRELAGQTDTGRASAARRAAASEDGEEPKTYTRAGLESDAAALADKLRQAVTDNAADPAFAANQPKMKELAMRLTVATQHYNDKMALAETKDDVELYLDEPDPMQDRPELAETPPSVLSSPYAGMEPRYVIQHDGRPDPIAKAKDSPPTEMAGARSEDEARLLYREDEAQQRRQAQTARPQTSTAPRPPTTKP